MPSHSRLARLQQALALVLLLVALAWLGWHWNASPAKALVGAAAVLLFPSGVLALEFLLLAAVARTDTTPRPTAPELVGAWWGESVQLYRVFGWRQPFRWNAIDDHLPGGTSSAGGVVFLHGFVCNRGFWNPWMHALRDRGIPHVAVNLEPVFGRIDDYVSIIDGAVARVAQASGRPPVLVCHSMGGLAARAWLRATANRAGVAQVVTIGSPHHGTWLGRFSHSPNGDQMRMASRWLQQLAADESVLTRSPRFTCWYSNCDNIVFPTSTATLRGADNRLVRGVAHVELAFVPEVLAGTLALVTGDPVNLSQESGSKLPT